MKEIIGLLLWTANQSPPFAKERFYKLKNRLLRKYGIYVGYDIQHIKKECWTCKGTGIYSGYYSDYMERRVDVKPQKCWKCNSGVYDEFWVTIEKWQIGKYLFHLPNQRSHTPIIAYDKNVNPIEGYIRHKTPKYHFADECFYFLALIFDFKLFMATFGHCRHVSTKFTPLVITGTAVFRIKMFCKKILRIPHNIRQWIKKRMNQRWIAQRLSDGELPF